MAEKRVVITGMGVVGPVGNNSYDFWEGIRHEKNGIAQITHFDTEGHKACMGAEVKDFVFPDKRAGKNSPCRRPGFTDRNHLYIP